MFQIVNFKLIILLFEQYFVKKSFTIVTDCKDTKNIINNKRNAKKIYINLLFIDLGHFYIPIPHKKEADCITAPRPTIIN